MSDHSNGKNIDVVDAKSPTKNGSGEALRSTHILSDDPAAEDAFGGHARVAQALADLVEEEEGGKAVALSGPYGSGKSTVIGLFEAKMKQREKDEKMQTRIFVFDAWAHQGDPLRRSFIEELVKFLRDPAVGWAKEDEWQRELDCLSRRREETDTESTPILTTWGRWAAVIALLLPIGYTLFSRFVTQAGTEQQTVLFGLIPLYILGLILILLPLVFVLLIFLWKKWLRKKRSSDEETEDPFYLFIQRTHKRNKTTTIRTPEPTTLEFQEIFNRILSKTLSGADRRLIIVVDNLDRLTSTEAIATWATMRTFFDPDARRQDDWRKQFWLFVPFDFEALSRIWSTRSDHAAKAQNEVDSVLSPKQKLQAFVDKTFLVHFRVAPPVLSDWKSFFIAQLAEGFPEHPKNSFHLIYRLYQLKGIRNNAPPTPRELKLFVNKLSALYRQWQDLIPLQLMALYVLIEHELSRGALELTKRDFLGDAVQAVLREPDWARYLAALHFNVQPDKAIQVLIGEPVLKALSDGDAASLQEIEMVPGFDEVVVSSVRDIFSEGSPGLIAASALALDELDNKTSHSLEEAWGYLRSGALRVQAWQPASEDTGRGLVAIWRHTPPEEHERLAERILKTFSEAEIEKPEQAAQWTDAVAPFIEALLSTEHRQLVEERLVVPGGAEEYVEAMIRLSEKPNADQLAPYFVPKAEPSAVSEALNKLCSSNNMRAKHADALRLMSFVRRSGKPLGWSWQALANSLNQRLQWNTNLSPEEAQGCIKAMLVLADIHEEQIVQNHLTTPAGKANLFHYLYQHRDNTDVAALFMLALLLYNPKGELGASNGNANNGRNLFNQILSEPDNHQELIDALVRLVAELNILWCLVTETQDAPNTSPFIKAVLRQFAEREDAVHHLDTEFVCRYLEITESALGEKTLQDIIRDLILQDNLIGWIQSEEGFQPSTYRLHELILSVCPESHRAAYVQYLAEELRKLNQEEWKTALVKETHLLDLTIRLVQQDEQLQLSTHYTNALLDHARKVRAGEVVVERSDLVGIWHYLLDAAEDDLRKTFISNLRDDLLGKPQDPVAPILPLYGDVLKTSGTLSEKPDETVRRLFTEIVSRSDQKELEWLIAVLTDLPQLLEKADSSTKKAFREHVKTQYNEGGASQQIQDLLRQIATASGVRPPMSKKDEGEGTAN